MTEAGKSGKRKPKKRTAWGRSCCLYCYSHFSASQSRSLPHESPELFPAGRTTPRPFCRGGLVVDPEPATRARRPGSLPLAFRAPGRESLSNEKRRPGPRIPTPNLCSQFWALGPSPAAPPPREPARPAPPPPPTRPGGWVSGRTGVSVHLASRVCRRPAEAQNLTESQRSLAGTAKRRPRPKIAGRNCRSLT